MTEPTHQFETERTRRFRAGQLGEEDQRTISNIEAFGCAVVHVRKFPDPPHTRVFLSEAVHSGTELITYVSHDVEDGAWQFLGDSMTRGSKPVISCFHHPIDKDSSLGDLADLPLGWWAERAKLGEPWVRHQHKQEEDD